MNIFLVGPMGSGKSSLGKKLAKSLDKKFIDTDKEIEKKENKTINEIFENNGEKYFREKEKEFLKSIPNSLNMVIATGGGIITDQENREKLNEFEDEIIAINIDKTRLRNHMYKWVTFHGLIPHIYNSFLTLIFYF